MDENLYDVSGAVASSGVSFAAPFEQRVLWESSVRQTASVDGGRSRRRLEASAASGTSPASGAASAGSFFRPAASGWCGHHSGAATATRSRRDTSWSAAWCASAARGRHLTWLCQSRVTGPVSNIVATGRIHDHRRSIDVSFCAPEGIRTPNLLIRRQLLYPLSYGRVSLLVSRTAVVTRRARLTPRLRSPRVGW